MTKRGSITVETAITFTLFLVFIAAIISAAQFYKTSILMQRAVEYSCEKVAILTPLSIPTSAAISTATNALPDLDIKGIDNVVKGLSYISGFDSSTGDPLSEMILENCFASYMAGDIRSRYEDLNNDSDFFKPDFIDVEYNINKNHSCIEVVVRYKVTTLVGDIDRKVFCIVPIYGDPQFLLYGSKSKADSNIWSEDNFTRGKYFREDAGSNLPNNFPVIDAYNNGTVTSIRSIDLTAPQYESYSKTEKVIMEEITKLKDFNGASYSSGDNKIDIPSSAIEKKKLVIIIPSNSSVENKTYVNAIKQTAWLHGVDMEVREQGESFKYK